jgi:hypothetical protein
MKKVTIQIEESKYPFFLELIKSLDFVSIEKEEDWFDNLSTADKKNIEKGIDDLENGRKHHHEDVMTLAKKRIAELKNNL